MIEVSKIAEFRGHSQAIYTLQPSWKPGHLLSAGAEGVIAEWNIGLEEAKQLIQAPCPIYAMHVNADRGYLAMGQRNGELAFADIHNNKMIRRVKAHEGAIFDIQPYNQGSNLLAGTSDGKLSIWNTETFECEAQISLSDKSIRSISVNPRTQEIAIGTSNFEIHLLNPDLTPHLTWKAHQNSVFRLIWDDAGETLFSTGRDAHIRSWSPTTSSLSIHQVPAHMYAVNDLILAKASQWLISGSMDKSIKIWEPTSLKLLKVISFEKHQCHFNGVNRLLWHEGKLFSCSDDRKIMHWELTEA